MTLQILMAKAAHERVRGRLAAVAEGLDVLTIDVEGRVWRGDTLAGDDIDPEVYWVSLDLYPAGLMPQVFGRILQGQKARWAQIFLAGLDNPAFRQLMAKGVRLTKSSAQAPPIAEFVVAHAISLLHPIDAQAAAQREHAWRRIPFREIANSRWLLVGYGNIGRGVAVRARAFGAQVDVVRRSQTPDPDVDGVFAMADLPALLPEADVVVLACALTDETRGLADARFFAAMKEGAILINIARGALIDEAALRSGLDAGRPGHAVLDVFDTEPLPPDAWFWDHPAVRVVAHASNAGDGVLARGDDLFLENLARYRSGQPLRHEAQPAEVGL
jgi:phosphoglycerate dehydrogenase-like enzyme